MLYYKFIRSSKCTHDFIFSSSKKPFKPVSYSTILTQFSSAITSFRKNFPEHFNEDYAESITQNITPHWLRHTWAYNTMMVLYEQHEKKCIKAGFINTQGLMEDVKEELRIQGGWSEKSTMPSKYAKRFIQDEANKKLMEAYSNHKDVDLFSDDSLMEGQLNGKRTSN